MQKKFIPVIIGTDAFGYFWSRSVYEAYGIKSYLVGKIKMALSSTSTFVEDIEYSEGDLQETEIFVSLLQAKAKRLRAKYPHTPLILIPTYDHYVRLTIENAETLAKDYLFHVPDAKHLDTFMLKEDFFHFAKEHDWPIPKTKITEAGEALDVSAIGFPLIVKPSDAISYNKTSFPGKEKVYFVHSQEALEAIDHKIREAGYRGTLILQEYIPGDDHYNYDMHCYTNQAGEMTFITFSQVLLSEPQATAVGNIAAQIVRYEPEMMEKVKGFFQEIGYHGYADVDLKKDPRTGEYKIFEVNMRVGRSGYYIDQLGGSIAKTLIDDLLNEAPPVQETKFMKGPFLSTYVPMGIIQRHVTDPALREEAMALKKAGKWGNPMLSKADLPLERRLYLALRAMNYYRKFRHGQAH